MYVDNFIQVPGSVSGNFCVLSFDQTVSVCYTGSISGHVQNCISDSFDQTVSVLYDPMLLMFQVPELTEAK
jgi:hypothetical protein